MDSQLILEKLRKTGLFLLELLKILGLLVYIYAEKLLRVFVPRPLKSLEGEVILLTGAGNGIGKQIALQLATVGATLICWDVEAAANERTVAEVRKKGGNKVKVHSYIVDISDREAIGKAAANIREEVGNVTVMINNAGIAPNGPFLEQDPDSMVKTFQVNLFAHFWIVREFLPAMIKQGRGHIVSIASLSSFVPVRDIAVYAASKHGVHGFIESLKQEIRLIPSKPNINFTTVYPNFVQTRLMDGITLKPKFLEKAPISSPEYVAQKIVEGFRQNYEHLILPPRDVVLALIRGIAPAVLMRKLEEGFFNIDVERHTVNGAGKKSK